MSLEHEIRSSTLKISPDSYDMSVGELINIYRDEELIVNPEFQRLFRWDSYQKSHFIESLLIGVPVPPIFVYEVETGLWELIDGLQRVSTILEFVGILRNDNGKNRAPSVLDKTRYLPSLEGASWDGGPENSKAIGTSNQITIKRARIGIQILRKASDQKAKYDLFQRLNSHGSIATPQELRNCTIYMISPELHARMKAASESENFVNLIHPTERGQSTQTLLDFLTRFLVFLFVKYDRSWDVEEYLDNGIFDLATNQLDRIAGMLKDFESTIELLKSTNEINILRPYRNERFAGRVGQAAFEVIFLGVARNLLHIQTKSNPRAFILSQAKSFWAQEDAAKFTRAGVRGTDRLSRSVPFGQAWFSK